MCNNPIDKNELFSNLFSFWSYDFKDLEIVHVTGLVWFKYNSFSHFGFSSYICPKNYKKVKIFKEWPSFDWTACMNTSLSQILQFLAFWIFDICTKNYKKLKFSEFDPVFSSALKSPYEIIQVRVLFLEHNLQVLVLPDTLNTFIKLFF
jgi:hypothetical protein